MRSNSNEFIDKLPVYLHGHSSKANVQTQIDSDSSGVVEDEEDEHLQGTLVSSVAR